MASFRGRRVPPAIGMYVAIERECVRAHAKPGAHARTRGAPHRGIATPPVVRDGGLPTSRLADEIAERGVDPPHQDDHREHRVGYVVPQPPHSHLIPEERRVVHERQEVGERCGGAHQPGEIRFQL